MLLLIVTVVLTFHEAVDDIIVSVWTVQYSAVSSCSQCIKSLKPAAVDENCCVHSVGCFDLVAYRWSSSKSVWMMILDNCTSVSICVRPLHCPTHPGSAQPGPVHPIDYQAQPSLARGPPKFTRSGSGGWMHQYTLQRSIWMILRVRKHKLSEKLSRKTAGVTMFANIGRHGMYM